MSKPVWEQVGLGRWKAYTCTYEQGIKGHVNGPTRRVRGWNGTVTFNIGEYLQNFKSLNTGKTAEDAMAICDESYNKLIETLKSRERSLHV